MQEPQASSFIKTETPTQVFYWEFFEIFLNTFFTEQLRTTASGPKGQDLEIAVVDKILWIMFNVHISMSYLESLSYINICTKNVYSLATCFLLLWMIWLEKSNFRFLGTMNLSPDTYYSSFIKLFWNLEFS